MTARAISTFPPAPICPTRTMTRWRRSNGRVARGDAQSDAPKRFFADGKFFTPDRRANFVATPFRGLAQKAGDGESRAQYRPRARPMAHDDPHRPRRAIVAAYRRAFRRTQSARRGACSASSTPDLVKLSNCARRRFCCARRSPSASGAAACSRRSTGPTSSPPPRASTRWSRRWSIRSPASRNPRERRSRSRRSTRPGTASP